VNPAFRIRKAEPRDGPAVLELVRALADFEHLPGPDDHAAQRIIDHGFGAHPCFEAILAEVERELAGFALYFFTYSTFAARPSLYLEDLFVRPEHRRQGIGSQLLHHLAAIAIERDCGRFEWTVLDWNESAQRFYQSLGAKVLPQWRICRIDDRSTLEALATGTQLRQ
jgi:GNAT superfamily N-acetyltransferase